MTHSDIIQLARELWWPHDESRTRDTALAKLDAGHHGRVTMEFEDVLQIVRDVQGNSPDERTCAELRELTDLWMALPWWAVLRRGSLSRVIVAKLRFRL